jgi:hypothetical protein
MATLRTGKPKGRPRQHTTPAVQVKIPPDTYAALVRLAEREGITFNGMPSVGRAVAWLVRHSALTAGTQSGTVSAETVPRDGTV